MVVPAIPFLMDSWLMIDLSRLCIHTITNKPWDFQRCVQEYVQHGIGGISIWQNAVEQTGVAMVAKTLHDAPIQVVSYVRGGFFPSTQAEDRQKSIDKNKRLLNEAAEIGAPLLVLVCGAEPRQSLDLSRRQISEGLEAILPHARANGVKLAIEPLHPMYADTRSAINTLAQANDLAQRFADPYLGVALDVYHCWWDEHLFAEITRCATHDHLFAYHLCDWKSPTLDLLNDRGLMGEGCIPLADISCHVRDCGFTGFWEVEIFSDRYWAMDQREFLRNIIKAYQNLMTACHNNQKSSG